MGKYVCTLCDVYFDEPKSAISTMVAGYVEMSSVCPECGSFWFEDVDEE